MYGIITTYPEHGPQNVGDNLITQSAKSFIEECCSEDPKFETYFRGDDFSGLVDTLNDYKAVFLPGFAVREPLNETYDVLNYLDKVNVPLVPIGAGWKSHPGDFEETISFKYSQQTTNYLHQLAEDLETFGVREYYTKNVFQNNGVNNASLVGDCAWYDPEYFGKGLRVPESISQVVVTTPHSDRYENQAKRLTTAVAEMFPNANLICSLHSVPTDTEQVIAEHCQDIGYEVREVSGAVSNIDFYRECDLHIGYRVHGHIAFLRKRQPSVLLNEDGRGAGFSYTFGTGGFNAFSPRIDPTTSRFKTFAENSTPVRGVRRLLSQKGRKRYARIPPDPTVIERVEHFVTEELDNGFQRYQQIPGLIDNTFQNRMCPLIEKYVT